MTPSEQFIAQLKEIKDYWDSQALPPEEKTDGVIFGILNLIDGNSSANDFEPLEIKNVFSDIRIDNGYLHELYHQ